MDHTYVEENDIIEPYLAGRLSESERDAFEAHYFDCETCLERLETANAFREGMRQAAAEDIAPIAAAQARLGLLAGLLALSRQHRLALAGAFLLLLAIPAFWLIESDRRNRDMERQLAAATTGAETAETRRAALEARLHGLEQARAEDHRRAEELTREHQTREAREASAPNAQPQVNVPLFLLAAVRSGEEAGREPVNQIALSPTAGSVILTTELATVDYTAYRATLQTAGGQEIWQAGGLRPDSRDTLVLLLPANMLQPGVYRLTIEGLKDGKGSTIGAYPFRVLRGER